MGSFIHDLIGVMLEGMGDVKARYVDTGKVPEDLFKQFQQTDFTKNKKYVEWMCREYVKNPENAGHIPDVARLFSAGVERKKIQGEQADIYKYSMEEADQIAQEASSTKSRKEKSDEIMSKDLVIVKDTDKYTIVLPRTHEASRLWALKHKYFRSNETDAQAGKNWCTTVKGPSYWDSYWRSGDNIYYIEMKDPKLDAILDNPDATEEDRDNALAKKFYYVQVHPFDDKGMTPEQKRKALEQYTTTGNGRNQSVPYKQIMKILGME